MSSRVSMPLGSASSPANADLADFVGQFADDPLGFVTACYPWREAGPLEAHDGPDTWQRAFLEQLGADVTARGFNGLTPVAPIRYAVSSGHGIGKSVLVAWLVDWIMSTRPHAQGTVTANTFTQLETKTWAAIRRWTKLCLTGHWFTINSSRMYHPAYPESWFCALQSSAEENSEAFAGQHAADSTSFYVVDEASAVPAAILDVAEGGLTDGEPMIFLFGNPTRNSGRFHEVAFGDKRDRWQTTVVDSRDSRFANKTLIAEWESDYGEDSDFFRVRVRGLPPSASDLQFIDSGRVYGAQRRVEMVLPDEPLVAGVDVSGGGSAWTVCRFRRGMDARTLPPIRLTGEQTRDRNRVIAVLAEALRQHPIKAMFVDSAFGSPIVERLHVLGFDQVHEVNFGGESPNVHQANQRAYQWNKMKEWLLTGAIPKDDVRLATDLTAPGFHLDKKDRLVLESKESMLKRQVDSPDDGDALSLTFAQPVNVTLGHVPAPYKPRSAWG
jgi:hypothetical protein